MRMSPRVAWQLVGGEAVVLDVESGRAVGLNEVGTFIWCNLDKLDSEQMVSSIVARFDIDESTARADLSAFFERFVKEERLLEEA